MIPFNPYHWKRKTSSTIKLANNLNSSQNCILKLHLLHKKKKRKTMNPASIFLPIVLTIIFVINKSLQQKNIEFKNIEEINQSRMTRISSLSESIKNLQKGRVISNFHRPPRPRNSTSEKIKIENPKSYCELTAKEDCAKPFSENPFIANYLTSPIQTLHSRKGRFNDKKNLVEVSCY